MSQFSVTSNMEDFKNNNNTNMQQFNDDDPSDKRREQSKWRVNKIRDTFNDILRNRGKSSVNREEIVAGLEGLEELIKQCKIHKSEQAQLTVMSILISFYFDTAQRKTTGMSGSRWRKTRNLITTMIELLNKNIDRLRISNDADITLILKDDDDDKEDKNKDNQINMTQSICPETSAVINIETNKKQKLDEKYEWIHGNLLSFIKKLTVQLWMGLKTLAIKCGMNELYEKERKKNIKLLMSTYNKAILYFGDNKLKNKEFQSEIEVLSMSVIHVDYNEKYDKLKEKIDLEKGKKNKNKNKNKKKIKKSISIKYGNEQIFNLPPSPIVKKAIFIFKNGRKRNENEAMLYLIYNMALHHQYKLCGDLLLMFYLGSSQKIGDTNIELQILYNRVLAQYAICSFINGYWYSAMIILQKLYSPHFHINNDLLQSVYLLSSLFIQIPNIINNSNHKLSNLRNQHFHKIWNEYTRRDLRVPPENTKDYILSTGIMIENGDWLKCKEVINKLKLWNEIKHNKYVKKKVFNTIKRECLRCYLYRYGSIYETISIQTLSQMFNLSISHTKQFIHKLIITKFLSLSLDELTQSVVIHKSPPISIQRDILKYMHKLSTLIQQNERLLGGRGSYITYNRSN